MNKITKGKDRSKVKLYQRLISVLLVAILVFTSVSPALALEIIGGSGGQSGHYPGSASSGAYTTNNTTEVMGYRFTYANGTGKKWADSVDLFR